VLEVEGDLGLAGAEGDGDAGQEVAEAEGIERGAAAGLGAAPGTVDGDEVVGRAVQGGEGQGDAVVGDDAAAGAVEVDLDEVGLAREELALLGGVVSTIARN
jgi:hypothetical protein